MGTDHTQRRWTVAGPIPIGRFARFIRIGCWLEIHYSGRAHYAYECMTCRGRKDCKFQAKRRTEDVIVSTEYLLSGFIMNKVNID